MWFNMYKEVTTMIIDYLKNATNLTSAEEAIRNSIVSNPSIVITQTIRELGASCNVSVASINRFCTKIGFQGFSDFKLNFIKEYKDLERSLLMEIPFNKDSTYTHALDYIPYIYEKTINYMKVSIDSQIVMRSIQQMKDAHILIFGTGLNKAIADIFAYKVEELGLSCTAYDSPHYQSIDAMKFKNIKMFAILITHSGENKSILDAAKKLHRVQIPSLLIYSGSESTIEKYCPDRIAMLKTQSSLELSNTKYMIATQYVLDVLVSLLLIENIDVVEYITNISKGKRIGDL